MVLKMVKILKENDRKEMEKIYEQLDKIDSMFIDINIQLRHLKKEFNLKRDQNLVERLQKNAEWSANRTLLLKGRIISDLGSNLFMDQEYLQFHIRRVSRPFPRNIKYISLRETNYRGKKFKAFTVRELGAKAHVSIEGDRITILSVLIPRNKKNLIVYK